MILRLGSTPIPPLARARVYVCGITPYDTTHLGHAATFVWVDAFSRVLKHIGVEPQVCRNVTDVDEALLAEAARLGVPWRTLATQQTYRFTEDMRKLRVQRPPYEPASQDYITEVVFLTRALLDQDAAYVRDGSVYFRGQDVPDAHGLTEERAIEMLAGHGGEPDDPAKDHPCDAVLWRRSGEGEPAWESPWGPGRPGWHVECSAMATTVLGLGVDVHAGGSDLAFPHHAYSSAMVEAATGIRPFVRAWMHIGTVMVDGAKMAKSDGNLVLVDNLLRDHPAEAIRLLILSRPWGEPWEYSPAALDQAASDLEHLWSAAATGESTPAASDEVVRRLVEGFDAQGAIEVAQDAGGEAARVLGKVLALL